jgi:hypothetical protein
VARTGRGARAAAPRRLAADARCDAPGAWADGALPSIIRQLDKAEDGREKALASAQLVCKAWYDAVSDAPGVKRTYNEMNAALYHARRAGFDEPPTEAHVPRTRVTSWMR